MRSSGIKIDLENSENLLFENAKKIEKILKFAVCEAVLSHKRAGNRIAVWKDGKAVSISPEEIRVEKI